MAQNSTQAAPLPASSRPGLARPDQIALGFFIACLVLASPLIFADRLPQVLLVFLALALLLVFTGRAVLTRSVLPHTAVDWLNVLALLLVPVGLWASADLSTSCLLYTSPSPRD